IARLLPHFETCMARPSEYPSDIQSRHCISRAIHSRACQARAVCRACAQGPTRISGAFGQKWPQRNGAVSGSRDGRGAQAGLELGETPGRADVEPHAPIHLPSELARRYRADQERPQRKLAGLAIVKELGREHTDARVREAIFVAFNEVPAI